ncbi:hypothetical protein ACH5RR_031841 [Cinchona calisaya]|uniref:Disease resistance N-terminal domain-containing protein n=1 Tax=Cinchona calisaya TaxID=153742 RepID=A0ABD2YGD5_9GENT
MDADDAAAAATASFDRIDSALVELRKKYYKHMGCNRDSDDCFFDSVNKITTDWELLKMLWALIRRNNDSSGAAAEYLGSEIITAADNFDFICKGMKEEKEDYSARKLVELASRGRKLSEVLIGEAIDQWYSLSLSQVPHPPAADDDAFWTSFVDPVMSNLDDPFWTSFVDSVMSNLRSIGWFGFRNAAASDDPNLRLVVQVFTFNKDVKLLRDYITQAAACNRTIAATAADVNAFLIHVASVIVRAAIESCKYWFLHKTTDPNLLNAQQPKCLFTRSLEDLQHEIDPTTNPKFLDLHLKFLITINRIAHVSNAATFTTAYEKVHIEFLLEQLGHLYKILMKQIVEDRKGVEKFFTPIVTFARRLTCFYYSRRPIPKDLIRKMTLALLELLDDANHIRLELKEIGPQILLPDFPRTYKVGFVDFLVTNLGELLKYDPDSIAPVKEHTEEIRLHLKSLSSFLMKVSESDIENQEQKDLGNHVIDLAYQFEFVVDSIETGAQWQHFFWFYDLLMELRLVDKQAFQIQTTVGDDKIQNISQVSYAMISRGRTPAIDEIMVELRNDEE